jgi:hypothetical protein
MMNIPQVEAHTGQGFSPDEMRRRCAEAHLQGRLAERERCARIAEGWNSECGDPADGVAVGIAEQIRKGE